MFDVNKRDLERQLASPKGPCEQTHKQPFESEDLLMDLIRPHDLVRTGSVASHVASYSSAL